MTPLMDVYRVEHAADRSGPFNGDHYADYRYLDAHDMPTIYGDRLNDTLAESVFGEGDRSDRRLPDYDGSEPWRFGFPSLETFARWFSMRDREALAQHGFVLAKYRLPRGAVVVRQNQVTFDAAMATEVNVWQLTRLPGMAQLAPRRLPA